MEAGVPTQRIPAQPWEQVGNSLRSAAHERTTTRMTLTEVPVTAIIALAIFATVAVTVGTLTLGILGTALFIAGLVTGWITSP